MTDLFEELQAMGEADEDNFIYLNEYGKPELKQELTFKWSQFPSKKFHITCRASDTISYIKTLLCVSLEKYSIFLGLRNLRVLNIHSSKETLPEVNNTQKGNIGDYIKSDTHFAFEIDSPELWLEVQIDFRDLGVVIFFEVKVPKETLIFTLKKLIADLLNHILSDESDGVTYTEDMLLIQSLRMTEEVLLATDLKSSMVTQRSKVKKLEELKNQDTVNMAFTYINRYLLCTPPPGRVAHAATRRKSIIREVYNPTIIRILQGTEFGFMVRAPRTEAKIPGKVQKVQYGEMGITQVEAQNSQVWNIMELSPTLQGIVELRTLRWIFVGGKGGVGKTTTASSLGILLAKHRESVLIISTDPAHNLSDAFDQKLGPSPTQIEGIPNLFGMEIKPNINPDNIDFPDIFGVTPDENSKSLIADIVNSIPGIDEAMSFSEMMRNVQTMPFSLIIFDTAPTGHTLRLLNFPSILDKGLTRIVSLKQNLGTLVNQLSAMMGRNNVDAVYNNVFDKMEQLKSVIEEINRQFKDPNLTTFVAVCIPEFLSMYETDRLVAELMKFEIDIGHIVINQVLFPEDECRMCIARQKMQNKYIVQIKEMFDDFHIVLNPLLDEEVRGVERLTMYSQFLIKGRS